MYTYIGLAIVAFLVLVVLCDFNVAAACVVEAVLLFGTASFVLNAADKSKPARAGLSLLDPSLQGRSNEQLALVEYARLDCELTAQLARHYGSEPDQLRFG